MNPKISDLTYEEICLGSEIYRKNSKANTIYNKVTRRVFEDWDNSDIVGRKIGVFLAIWNADFYKHGTLNVNKISQAVEENKEKLTEFRDRSILSFGVDDDEEIIKLFETFLDATSVITPEDKILTSPTSTAKTQHVLAPNFFPLWDRKIAEGWDCSFDEDNAAESYLKFMELNRQVIEEHEFLTLKIIDECSYAMFTKDWYDP